MLAVALVMLACAQTCIADGCSGARSTQSSVSAQLPTRLPPHGWTLPQVPLPTTPPVPVPPVPVPPVPVPPVPVFPPPPPSRLSDVLPQPIAANARKRTETPIK